MTEKKSSLATLQGMGGKLLGAGEELQRLAGNAGLPAAPTDALGAASIGATPDQQKMAGTAAQMGAALRMTLNPQETVAYQQRTTTGRTTAKEGMTADALPESLRALAGLSGKIQAATTKAIADLKTAPGVNLIPSIGVMADYIGTIRQDFTEQSKILNAAQALQTALKSTEGTEAERAAKINTAMDTVKGLVNADEFKKLFGTDETTWMRNVKEAIPPSMTLKQILEANLQDAVTGQEIYTALDANSMGEIAAALTDPDEEAWKSSSDVLNKSWDDIKNRLQNLINRKYADVNLLRQQTEDLTLPVSTRNAALQRLRELGVAGKVYQAQQADLLKERVERGDNILFNGEYRELEDVLSDDTVQDTLRGVLSGKITTEQLKGTVYSPLIPIINGHMDELEKTYGISPSKEVQTYRTEELYQEATNRQEREVAFQEYRDRSASKLSYGQLEEQIKTLAASAASPEGIKGTEDVIATLESFKARAESKPEWNWMLDDINQKLGDARGILTTQESNATAKAQSVAGSAARYTKLEDTTAALKELEGLYVTESNKQEIASAMASVTAKDAEIKDAEFQKQLRAWGIMDTASAEKADPGDVQKNLDALKKAKDDPNTPQYIKDRIQPEIDRLEPLYASRVVSTFLSSGQFPIDQTTAEGMDDSDLATMLSSLSAELEKTPESAKGPLNTAYNLIKAAYDKNFEAEGGVLKGMTGTYVNSLLTIADTKDAREKLTALGNVTGENKKLFEDALKALDARDTAIYGKAVGDMNTGLGKVQSIEDLNKIYTDWTNLGGTDEANAEAYAGVKTQLDTLAAGMLDTLSATRGSEADLRSAASSLDKLLASPLYAEAQKNQARAAAVTLRNNANTKQVEGLTGDASSLDSTSIMKRLGDYDSLLSSLTAPGAVLTAEQKDLLAKLTAARPVLEDRRQELVKSIVPAEFATANTLAGQRGPGGEYATNAALLDAQTKLRDQVNSLLNSKLLTPGSPEEAEWRGILSQLDGAIGKDGTVGTVAQLAQQDKQSTTKTSSVGVLNTALETAGLPQTFNLTNLDSLTQTQRELFGITDAMAKGDAPFVLNENLQFFTQGNDAQKAVLRKILESASNETRTKELRALFLGGNDSPWSWKQVWRYGTPAEAGLKTATDVDNMLLNYDTGKRFLNDIKSEGGGFNVLGDRLGLPPGTLEQMQTSNTNFKTEFGIDLPSWLDQNNDEKIDDIKTIRGKITSIEEKGAGSVYNFFTNTSQEMSGKLQSAAADYGTTKDLGIFKQDPASYVKGLWGNSGELLNSMRGVQGHPYLSPQNVDSFTNSLNSYKKIRDNMQTELDSMKAARDSLRDKTGAYKKKLDDYIGVLEGNIQVQDTMMLEAEAKLAEQGRTNPFMRDTKGIGKEKITLTRTGGFLGSVSSTWTVAQLAALTNTELENQTKNIPAASRGKWRNLIAIYKRRMGLSLNRTTQAWYDSAVQKASSGGKFY